MDENMDMDLDLDNVDLDDIDLDNADLTDFGEINETIDEPHLKIGSKSFKEFLKVAKRVSATGGKDIISKATCLQYDPDRAKVVGYATDFDVYIESELENLDTENILMDPVIVPTDIFIKLTGAVPANTIIYKKDDKFFIRLYGGDMELETHQMSVDKFQFTEEIEEKATVDVVNLYSILKDFSPVVSAAANPAEKRIMVSEEGAFANYAFAILKSETVKGDYDLKPKDIDVLKGLTLKKKDIDLKVYKTTEGTKATRCVIKGDDFKYAFLVSDAAMSDTLKSNMSTVVNQDGIYIDFIQFYKIVELAADLPYSLGKVGMNVGEDGVVLNIKTKKGTDNSFNITGSFDGTPKVLSSELIIQAKLLRVLLRSFAAKQSVKVIITDMALGIVSDDYESVIYTEVK